LFPVLFCLSFAERDVALDGTPGRLYSPITRLWDYSTTMLNLDRQNAYRARYQATHPGWQASGQVYESFIRQQAVGQHPHAAAFRWLDVGCGRGGIVELLGGEVTLCVGADLDLVSLREQRALHMRRVAAPADALPFANGSFDLVTCSWVMEHLADPRRAFAEIARVLAPGGHWMFLTPNARNPLTLANRLIRGPLQARLVRRLYARAESDTFPVRYRANTPARIEQLAQQVGLCPVQIHLVGDPTYLAFNDALFALSSLLERITPASFRVHIVGDYTK
jgi:ubiquinone/menaquinone biosynthesis C-methylase UbiE